MKKAKKVLKLDLGCGDNKRDGFFGIDIAKTKSTDMVRDLFKFPWPFEDNSVDEIFASHFFEHVPQKIRGKFMDEIYRILKPCEKDPNNPNIPIKGFCQFIVPYWSSMRSVQDFTHEWPPICETSFLYFNKQWRDTNKLSHYGVKCDFDFSYAYSPDPILMTKNEVYRAEAFKSDINSIMDLNVTLMKR